MAWEIAKPRVTVCTPMRDEQVTMEFSLRMLLPLAAYVDWCDKDFKASRGVPVGVARDQLVKMFLEDKAATHILWVDTDSVCESPADPNQALRMLLSLNYPITSGLYRAKKSGGFTYAMWAKADLPNNELGFTPIQGWTGNWIEADVVGMGFILMKREVFEKVPPPWFVWNDITPSEDFFFCMKAKEHGYSVRVFTDVKVSHIGLLKVRADGSVVPLEI